MHVYAFVLVLTLLVVPRTGSVCTTSRAPCELNYLYSCHCAIVAAYYSREPWVCMCVHTLRSTVCSFRCISWCEVRITAAAQGIQTRLDYETLSHFVRHELIPPRWVATKRPRSIRGSCGHGADPRQLIQTAPVSSFSFFVGRYRCVEYPCHTRNFDSTLLRGLFQRAFRETTRAMTHDIMPSMASTV
jgi:hypothetical protein